MKKRVFVFILSALMLISVFSLTSFAEKPPRLVDGAYLLTDAEAERVTALLDRISVDNDFDVVIVTVSDTGFEDIVDFADDYYDYNGYGMGSNFDGVLLLISMEEIDWYISTCGFGLTAFTESGIQYIGESITEDLSSGLYEDAFTDFANLCESFVVQARTGDPYEFKEPYGVFSSLILSLIVGFVVAFIAVSSMKSKLNGAVRQRAAENYVRRDSMELTVCRDSFLYRNVVRTAKQSSNSSSGSHRSSSGRSHGGGGGKF